MCNKACALSYLQLGCSTCEQVILQCNAPFFQEWINFLQCDVSVITSQLTKLRVLHMHLLNPAQSDAKNTNPAHCSTPSPTVAFCLNGCPVTAPCSTFGQIHARPPRALESWKVGGS